VLKKLGQIAGEDAFSVFVVSRRCVAELSELVNVPGVNFVGQGGFEIKRGDEPTYFPVDPRVAGGVIQDLEHGAMGCLACFPRVKVENRGFTVAIRLPDRDEDAAREASQRFLALVREMDSRRQLEVFYREGAVEARLSGWNKGHAVSHILSDEDVVETLAIYVGDDFTDEDAFEAVTEWSNLDEPEPSWAPPDIDEDDELPPRAITVLVADSPRPSGASLFVRSPKEVYEFVSSLAAVASSIL
jgi:trehalose-phosphatase